MLQKELIMMKHLLIFLLVLNAFAQDSSHTLKRDYEDIAESYENEELKLRTKMAIAVIVNTSAVELIKHGHVKEARELREQWKSQSVRHFSDNLSIYDLGDYEPLNQWLADWYDRLESKIPARIFNLTRLEDIKILNYGIPVVFYPVSDLWDREEYSKHFVPFTATISYWSFKVGCKVSSLEPIPGLICDIAAKGFEKVVEKEIAPKLSDRIYDRAHIDLQ